MTQLLSSLLPTVSIPTDLLVAQDNLRTMQLELAEVKGDRLNMDDGIVDPFGDQTDINTTLSSGQLYDSTNKRYGPSSNSTASLVVSGPEFAISGGDYGAATKNKAFDGDTTINNVWGASQTTANQSGNAYIGQDFGAGNAYALTSINYWQYTSTTDNMSSVLIQYSDNGTTWTTNQSASLTTTANFAGTVTVTGTPGAHRYWRWLANANLTSGNIWYQNELQFIASTPVSTNLATSAQAISGGDFNTTNVKGHAFDGNTSSVWESSQTLTGVSGVSYIGQDFGSAYKLAVITVTNFSTASYNPPTVNLQYSDDATTWTTLNIINLTTIAGGVTTVNVNNTASAHRYWRLLAAANCGSGSAWYVAECTMTTRASLYNNITLQSVAFPTSVVSPSTARVCLQLDGASGASTFQVQAPNGTAIADSVYSSQLASYAFDGNIGTYWESATATDSTSGVAWIGMDFGAGNSYAITQVVVTNSNLPGSNNISSVIIQYSDNGTTWVSNQTAVLVTTNSGVSTIAITGSPGSHRYWRLLANSNPNQGKGWPVGELVFNYTSTSGGSTDYSNLLQAYVSRDGGTTFTQGILSLDLTLSDGTSIYETSDIDISTQPAGSSMVYQLGTINNNNLIIDAAIFQWRS